MHTTPRIKRTYGKRRTTPNSGETLNSALRFGESTSSPVHQKKTAVPEKDLEPTPVKAKTNDPWKAVESLSSGPRKKLSLVSNLESKSLDDEIDGDEGDNNDARDDSSEIKEDIERHAGESQNEPPKTPMIGVKRMRAPTYSSSVKRTYGERRTYQPDKISTPVRGGEESDDDLSDESSKVRDANELGTIGTHSQFLEELQFAIEGIKGDLNMKRITLTEIAQKIKDKDFVNKMKTTHFPSVLFTEGTTVEDSYCSFVMGIIISRCFEAGVGLAVSMVSDFNICEYLVNMLQDTDDIRTVIRNQKGISKAVKMSLEELIEDNAVSRGFVALRAIRSLESHGQIMPFVRENLSQYTGKFVELLGKLVENVEVHLKSIQLLMLHLEFMLNGENVETTLKLFEVEEQNPLRQLVSYCKTQDEPVVTGIIQLFIVITSNLSPGSEYGSEIYDEEFAGKLLEYGVMCMMAKETSDMELFCWGLLVNLTEMDDLCANLTGNEKLMKKVSNALDKYNLVEDDFTKSSDCQGYQCLTFGQMACHNRESFDMNQITTLKRGLERFGQVVNGPGLQAQVFKTLKELQQTER